jgi:predicted CXXCH cytochrome family protein
MNKLRYARAFALFLLSLLTTAASADAGNAELTEEAQACLGCHARHGLRTTFENNEFVEARLDPETYRTSVHSSLSCSQCHPDFAGGKHPQRTFRTKRQYQTRSALVCRGCHTDRDLRASGIHQTLKKEEKSGTPTVCTNCHGAHAVAPTGKTRNSAGEEEYCMKCHGYSAKMTFRNGETLSGAINLTTLQASVHHKLSCSDCHYGFSSEEHPGRNFATRRDYTLASSETCRRCHFDKFTKTMESIHYAMLSRGRLEAPVCIDCHGSHGISRLSGERALIAGRCRTCHADIYDSYAKSVHGSALLNERNPDVPVCADCHAAHTAQDPRTLDYRERVPEMCGNCHANEAVVGKYGLSVSVVDTYLSDFHGVTLSLRKLRKNAVQKPSKPMAVCTDCHGTHDISSTVGPDATIVKARLAKSCGKCHAEAPPDFPDAWLSHYPPSLSRAPLVFFINLAYTIFIPVLAVGLVLQILLHIWRYVVDR